MKKILLISIILTLVLFVSSTSSLAQEKTILRVAAGGLQGQWFATSAALAEIVASEDSSIQIDVVPGAGLANPPRVGVGEIEMAMSFPIFTKTAVDGITPFDDAYPDIRGIIKGFGPSMMQFIVSADVPYDTVEDLLKNKYPIDLATERMGTTDEYCLTQVLAYYGVDYDTIKEWGGSVRHGGYGDMINLFKDGHVNAGFQNIAAPSPSILEIATSREIKVLKFSDELVSDFNEKFAYSVETIPAGTYGVVEEDLKSPGVTASWIAHKDISEDVIYRITKIICENPEKVREIHASTVGFNPEDAAFDLGAPLHPGAERYYKEVGYID